MSENAGHAPTVLTAKSPPTLLAVLAVTPRRAFAEGNNRPRRAGTTKPHIRADRRAIAFLCQGEPEEFGGESATIVGFKTMAALLGDAFPVWRDLNTFHR